MFRSLRSAGLVLAAVVGLSSLSAYAADALPVAVPLTDPAVHFVGRWDTSKPETPRTDWSASEVALHFKGTAANIKIKGGGEDQLQLVVDGEPTAERVKVSGTMATYSIATGLADKEHTIQVIKCTEANVGTLQVSGFEISEGGKALPWTAKPAHRIEMIGDSITCGYGNLDTDKGHHWSPSTENSYYTYGLITARAFNAECNIVAWSGRKMWPKNTTPSIYGQTLANDGKTKWDASKWTADVVVINLATNDFGAKAPKDPKDPNERPQDNPKEWTGAYEKFITDSLRKNYPNADIFIATSPMMYGKDLDILKKYLATIKSDLEAAGDKKIHILPLAGQDPKDGYGADWHPNITTHKKMAAVLIKSIETECGWKAEEKPETKAPDKAAN